MQAFYINLDSAISRRNLIEHQIKSSHLNFPITRFQAVVGKDFPFKNDNLSHGQWGCWLSHLSVLKSNIDNEDDLLIMEDDAHFDSSLCSIEIMIDELKSDAWDIIYLDATIVEIEDFLLLSRQLNEFITFQHPPSPVKIPNKLTIYGTHAYIINKKSKAKIYTYLCKHINSGLPIDNILCHGIHTDEISAYLTLPYLSSPGGESGTSQININDHSLLESWIRYRKLISIHGIYSSTNDKKSEMLEKITQETIQKRINFNCLKMFRPMR